MWRREYKPRHAVPARSPLCACGPSCGPLSGRLNRPLAAKPTLAFQLGPRLFEFDPLLHAGMFLKPCGDDYAGTRSHLTATTVDGRRPRAKRPGFRPGERRHSPHEEDGRRRLRGYTEAPTRARPEAGPTMELQLSRGLDQGHHVNQGAAWLATSHEGAHTVPLTYAAFEYRLAVERLAMQYLAAVRGRPPEAKDLDDLRTYKTMESLIYGLGGHQKQINGHFEFMRLVMSFLKIEQKLVTPDFGKLSNYWHTCSDLCHVGGVLFLQDTDFARSAYRELSALGEALQEQVSGLVTWPNITDDGFRTLGIDFIEGRITADDVFRYLKRIGIWAALTVPGQQGWTPLGEPIIPEQSGEPETT